MAKARYRPTTAPTASEDDKIARLRQMRLANDSAKREAGTWGEMSVIEIAHEPSGEMFVLSWKGTRMPDLARLARLRPPGLPLDEHERLQAWLTERDAEDLKQSLVGWNLSAAAAKQAKETRIAAGKAGGRRVVNDAPAGA
jgi:hypothetical protein